MKLFYRKFGKGQPFIILHGLFGQSDNWNTFAQQFADCGFEVFIVDLRNHGLSPHDDVWNYQVMSDDILELINDNNLQNVILLGHSMGGKIVMQFAIEQEHLLDKLIVVDMAPKYYPMMLQPILDGLNAVDFKSLKTRKEVENILSGYIDDVGTNQFLLKNIYWKTDTELAWRFNLKAISENIEIIGSVIESKSACKTNTLFIRGGKSNYVLDEDMISIRSLFPNAKLETIADAGHWIHAEKPKAFFECVMKFII